MQRAWNRSAKLLTGFFAASMYAMPQATISARPGVINYIEGQAFWNGQAISPKARGPNLILNSNDTLSTTVGKVEVLLNPGVFLRLGDNTQIRMISPSLANPQVEVAQGEAILEVVQIVKGSQIQIADSGASITVRKGGVYRITAQPQPTVEVYAGKVEVQFNGRSREAGKGHQVILTANLPEHGFNTKAPDELYAWSNVRSEYDAGASFASASSLYANNSAGAGYGGYTPGWYWNSGWDSWAWLPGGNYFFSPFGWGFYSPFYTGYAPVVYTSVGGGRYGPVPIHPKSPLADGFPRGPAIPSRLNTPTLSARGLANSSRTTSSRGFFGGSRPSASNGSRASVGRSSSGSSGGGGFHSSGGGFSGGASRGASGGGGGSHAGGGGSAGGGGHR
ncbi:MAG: FecR family protein [Bryobacteraceae bacterium]